MKIDKLNVGVIGAGKMGLLHAGIFNSLNGSRISAISEKDGFMANALGKYLSRVNIYRDYVVMLENEPLDLIVITTPVYLHKAMIEKAMEYDLHIFVEKPLALNGNECRSICLNEYKSKTLVGYCRRFMATYSLAKKLIEDSTLGNINYFHSTLFMSQISQKGTGWLYDPYKSGGGVLMDLGSHAIDMFHYLFGQISSVYGISKFIYNEKVEDYLSMLLKFPKNFIGSSQISWSIRGYRLPELKINTYFESGRITVTEKYIEIWSDLGTDNFKKGSNIFYKQDLTRDVPINIGGTEYTLEDLHLINCIRDNKRTLCDFQESGKTNFVIDSIYRSAKEDTVEKIVYR